MRQRKLFPENGLTSHTGWKQLAWIWTTIFVCSFAYSVCREAWASSPSPRSVLVLDQSAPLRPWSTAIINAVQSGTSDKFDLPVSYHVEHLDLFGFGRRPYDDNLLRHLTDKYADKQINAILSIGPAALDFAIKLRAAAWPSVPIVFTALTEGSAPKPLPPNTTGFFVQKTFANMVEAARGIIPDLRRLVLVGNPFEGAIYYPQFAKEIPELSRKFEIVDLMGLPVSEIRRRVAVLPADSAVFYFGINADSEKTYSSAVEALPLIAEAANRPIIGDAETEVGAGAIGGFVLKPGEIGLDAGRVVLRILEGEDASTIPAAVSQTLQPMFDWRQLQRWNITDNMLPAGSEIRFRRPGMWDQYSHQIVAAGAAFFMQIGLICWLIFEHRRRHLAEIQSRNVMTELTYMNRRAAAGQLSASIAHEVNQPLTGIVTRAGAALRWLRAEAPNLKRAEAALEQILTAGHRASDIITSVRAMFQKEDSGERVPVDINGIILTVLAIVRLDLQKNGVLLQTKLDEREVIVQGDKIQLQQVVLNVVMNAIEAMQGALPRTLSVRSAKIGTDVVHVSIEDSGTGIDPGNLDRIFSPLFTTKQHGMGMGLSICQSIIKNHNGRICISPGKVRGSIVYFELPIKDDQESDGRGLVSPADRLNIPYVGEKPTPGRRLDLCVPEREQG